ncbi:MAG: divalent metal cation transporter [Candidatus Aminicenantes bacterium]|nr:divalent metal cation transporter [Candidatus Aminicenantes bacterium]
MKVCRSISMNSTKIKNNTKIQSESQVLRRGFPLVESRDPEALDKERDQLESINSRPYIWQRWKGYWSLSGPGWVQSALTLGAGSAGSAIFAGAVTGYKLLWVQPLAMFLGVMMFAAIGHQTLITRARPYDVFWKKLHPSLALLWGFNVFIASIVWQFPQYSLGTSVAKDLFAVAGIDLPRGAVALGLLAGGTAICWTYGSGKRKGILLFERILKYMLLIMVCSFFLVVLKTGIKWGELFKGYFAFHLPADKEGLTIVLGQLGAAVGVNMTFLYPYTLLARGWGKSHKGLKNFDLGVSMFLPFVLATSFVTIACANTLFTQGIQVKDAIDAAHALQPIAGLTLGRVLFSLGILSMCFTTLIIEMLLCGLVLSEIFHFEYYGWAFKASTLAANIGIIGAFYPMPIWLPVLTSSFNLLMMPIAYICFFILQNKKSFLGEDINWGMKGALMNFFLILAIIAVTAGAAVKILSVLDIW